MDLASQPAYTYSKAQQTHKERQKPTRKQRGHISPSVSKAVKLRSGNRCERCGWSPGNYDPTGKRMGLQNAHLIRRGKIEIQTNANDVARLCGPSVNSGTCHHFVDYSAQGREWAKEYREYLIAREKCEKFLKAREQA